MKLGETLEFKIEENPTTGYILIVEDSEQDVFKASSRFEKYADYLHKPVMGAGGTRVY